MTEFEDPEGSEDIFEDKIDYSRPFRVRVVRDCRDGEKLEATGSFDGQFGWCLGYYEYPDVTKKRPEGITEDFAILQPELGDDSDFAFYNPLIYTDSGQYVWGIECYWDEHKGWLKDIPLDLAQKAVEMEAQRLRVNLGIDIAINLN